MSNRLARFRGYMAALNAIDASSALAQGYYVPGPGSISTDRLTARLQLQPTASVAVVGGIGSGKTTQLLILRDKLAQASDIHPVYIDVADSVDLAHLSAGVISALAGQAIGRLVGGDTPPIAGAKQRFDRWVHGYDVQVVVDPRDYDPPEPDDYDEQYHERYVETQRVPGRVVPPQRPLFPSVLETAEPLRCLLLALEGKHVVLLLDSLDRLSAADKFSTVVEQDVRALSSAGVGVVMAAPLRTLFGTWRVVLERFDSFEYLPPVDVDDESGRDFLARVLAARVPGDGVGTAAAGQLARSSGGVLRDFLTLARLAAEEAYLSGAERIEVEHVHKAADAFGRKHLLGVTPAQLEVLQRVRSRREFVPTGDDDLALLMTRRVLEYQRARVEYALHPTLVPLLRQLAHAA